MSKQKDAMTPARWLRIKATQPSRPRYVHVSCESGMRNDPGNPMGPRIPWVSRGTTFAAGRNAAKRERRLRA